MGWILQFYLLLRTIVRIKASGRQCLARCRHCGIFFLTLACNRRRTDLACPFGCREAHRKQSSRQRSQAYYRTEAGRVKKRALNRKRRLLSARPLPPPPPPPTPPLEVGPIPPVLAGHIRWVVGLIEGRRIREPEFLEWMAKIVRQRRLGRTRRIDYAVARLNKGPPESLR